MGHDHRPPSRMRGHRHQTPPTSSTTTTTNHTAMRVILLGGRTKAWGHHVTRGRGLLLGVMMGKERLRWHLVVPWVGVARHGRRGVAHKRGCGFKERPPARAFGQLLFIFI